jgi:hypothetical protein
MRGALGAGRLAVALARRKTSFAMLPAPSSRALLTEKYYPFAIMANGAPRSSLAAWLVDPLAPTRSGAGENYRFTGPTSAWLAPVGLGAALLILSLVGWAIAPKTFFFSYLVGWTFCLTISLGALYFLFFHHLTKASWHIVVRRIAEHLAWGFPLLAVLGIPLFAFGMHDLYHWTHAELYTPGSAGYDPIIAGKRAYLNTPFFYARLVLYFGAWTYISHRLYTVSVRHDVRTDYDSPIKLRTVSAWGLPVTAITTAFASYDLLMSLAPHWFSTIFGVYFFAGAAFAVFAVLVLAAALLQKGGGLLTHAITAEHYHDLGKWMFGFTVFWAYIAFSQYMLYWYGGIPEETVWFRHRLEHGWGWHSAMLLILHFIVPFVVLLPRWTKRIVPVLSVMAVWFLVMHWFDLHWVAMPSMGEGTESGYVHGGFHWLNFTTWLGLAGIYFGAVIWRMRRHPLVPQNDPRLEESLAFENV